jgi:dolichyl-phosphate-mannose-protein mannosyltransferase
MSAPTRRNVPSHQLSAPLPPLATTTKLTVESEADTRLRDRDGSPPRAFGGKRRNSSLRAGTIGGLKRREWWILGVITALGVLVRFWNISWPDSVV